MKKYKCIIEDSKMDAKFCFEKQNIPYYCQAHKEEDMVYLRAKNIINGRIFSKEIIYKNTKSSKPKQVSKLQHCIFNGCLKIAGYNYAESTVPLLCICHKRYKMVNVLPSAKKKSNWKVLDKYVNDLLKTHKNCSTDNSAILQEYLKT